MNRNQCDSEIISWSFCKASAPASANQWDIRPDPAMSGLNHYAYANCNPIMYNDPTGLWEKDSWREKWNAWREKWREKVDQWREAREERESERNATRYSEKNTDTTSETIVFAENDTSTSVTQSDGGVGLGGGTGKLKNDISFGDRLKLWATFGLFGSSPIDKKEWSSRNGWIGTDGLFGSMAYQEIRRGPHSNIDFSIGLKTPVESTAGGNVIFAGIRGAWGNSVIIQHGFRIRTYYNHLDSVNVSLGRIKTGAIIGYVGNTPGGMGYHLDYGVSMKGFYINPTHTLPGWINIPE